MYNTNILNKVTTRELKKLKIAFACVLLFLFTTIAVIGYNNSNVQDGDDIKKYSIHLKVETETTTSEGLIEILTIEAQYKTGFDINTMKKRLDELYLKAKLSGALHTNIDKQVNNLAWMYIKHNTRRKENNKLTMLLGPKNLSKTLSVPIQHNTWYRFEYKPELYISGLAVT
jgi:hypothetical protein